CGNWRAPASRARASRKKERTRGGERVFRRSRGRFSRPARRLTGEVSSFRRGGKRDARPPPPGVICSGAPRPRGRSFEEGVEGARMPRLVIVSNRLPFSLAKTSRGGYAFRASSGGLVTALGDYLKRERDEKGL